MKILASILMALMTFSAVSVGDGLVRPVYGSPKYNVDITRTGRSGHPYVEWTVEVGEVYIVDGYDPSSKYGGTDGQWHYSRLLIRMGGYTCSVPVDAISFVPPDHKDYAEAARTYAKGARDEQESEKEESAQERADSERRQAYFRALLPIEIDVHNFKN